MQSVAVNICSGYQAMIFISYSELNQLVYCLADFDNYNCIYH